MFEDIEKLRIKQTAVIWWQQQEERCFLFILLIIACKLLWPVNYPVYTGMNLDIV